MAGATGTVRRSGFDHMVRDRASYSACGDTPTHTAPYTAYTAHRSVSARSDCARSGSRTTWRTADTHEYIRSCTRAHTPARARTWLYNLDARDLVSTDRRSRCTGDRTQVPRHMLCCIFAPVALRNSATFCHVRTAVTSELSPRIAWCIFPSMDLCTGARKAAFCHT